MLEKRLEEVGRIQAPLDAEVRLLVNKLLEFNAPTLTPEFDIAEGCRYRIVEDLLGKNPKDAVSFLNSLVGMGVLEQKLTDKFVQCPSCNSVHVPLTLRCPTCSNFDIDKKILYEHLKCGFIQIEDKFKSDGQLLCPKCHVEITKPGVELRSVGVWFTCAQCNKTFDEPVSVLQCRKCGAKFPPRESNLLGCYAYTLTEESRESMTKGLITIQPIKEALQEAGYSVEAPGITHGSSGAAHGFDIVATKTGAEGGKMTVVLDVVTSQVPIDEHPIISLFAKVFDVSPTKAILIAIPSLNETGKKLAAMYKLAVIEGLSVEKAISQLKELLST